MSKKFQLQIPEPCHEDWNKMTPVDKGRFCDSCQKAVHDFTGMSDAQLIAFFKKPSTGFICGRFYNDQLDRDFEIPRKRLPWIKYFFQFTLPIFLTSLKTQAQENIRLKEKNIPTVCERQSRAMVGAVYLPVNSKKISGLIVDEKNIGIPYASVTIKGTKEGVMCDSTGFFKLEIPADQKKIALTASCVGYSTAEKEINARKDDFTEIRLATNATLNGEVVVTAAISNVRIGLLVSGYTISVKQTSFLQKVKSVFVFDSVKIFPNPAKSGDELKIEFKMAEEVEYTIDLYSLQGQLVKSSSAKIEAGIKFFTFQLPSITPGSYVLRLTNKKSGKKHVEKIIIL